MYFCKHIHQDPWTGIFKVEMLPQCLLCCVCSRCRQSVHRTLAAHLSLCVLCVCLFL